MSSAMNSFSAASAAARSIGVSEAAIAKIWWQEWNRTWSCIATAIVLKHNLPVLVQSESPATRKEAAREIADTIAAILAVAVQS